MTIRKIHITIAIVAAVLAVQAVFAPRAFATYVTTGSVTSTNLLSGSSASVITNFYYNISSIPGNSSVTVQFSTTSTAWYSSAGVLNGSDTLSTTGGANLSLLSLGSSGSAFYYKMTLNSTSDQLGTPAVSDIRLDYTPTSGYGDPFAVDTAGNVNIGTVGAKLSVQSGETIGSGFFTTTAPTNGLLVQGSLGLGTTTPWGLLSLSALSSNTSPLLAISTSTASATSTAFIIDSNGKVGIGTTSPYAQLSVAGLVAAGSFNADNASATSTFRGGIIGPGSFTVQSGSGFLGIGTTSPSSLLSVQGNSYVSGSSFFGGAITGTSTLAIQGTGNSYILGNVGIGTTSPTNRLEVSGNTFLGGTLTATGSISTSGNISSTGSYIYGNTIKANGAALDASAYYNGVVMTNAVPLFWSSTSGLTGQPDLLLWRDAANILAQRNGTNGQSLRLYNTYTDASNYERAGFNWSSNILQIGTENMGTGSSRYLAFMTGSTTRMTIDTSGNIGVGTSSPWRTFSVNGTVSLAGLTSSSANQTYSLCMDSSNDVIADTVAAGCVASSARFKHDITSLDVSGLSTVMALRPVSFIYNTDLSSTTQLGFVAEEAAKVDPRLVGYGSDGLPRTFKYENYTSVLTKAIQEQQGEIGVLASSTGALALGMSNMGTSTASTLQALSANYQLLSSNISALASSSQTTATLAAALDSTNTSLLALGQRVDSMFASTTLITALASNENLIGGVSGALLASTSDFVASTSASVASRLASSTEFASVMSAAVASNLASSTAEILLADVAGANAAGTSTSMSATSTMPTTFIGRVAAAVGNMIASAGNWMVDRLTARVAYVGRVEAKTVAISDGLEMTDSSTGTIYCVRITNGEFAKVPGACDTAATATTSTATAAGAMGTANLNTTIAPITTTNAVAAPASNTQTAAVVNTPAVGNQAVTIAAATSTPVIEVGSQSSTSTPATAAPAVIEIPAPMVPVPELAPAPAATAPSPVTAPVSSTDASVAQPVSSPVTVSDSPAVPASTP